MVSTRVFAVSLVIAILATAAATSAVFLTVYPPGSGKQVVGVTRYVGGLTTDEAPAYVPQAERYYLQNGIDVTPVILSGTSAAVQAVGADKTGYAFALGDLLDLTVDAAQNPNTFNLIQVASTGRVNPVGVLFLTTSGIHAPKDLIGKTVGSPFGSLSFRMFSAFLTLEGISPSQITIQNIGFSALQDALLGKKVDAIVQFASASGSLQQNAAKLGETVNFFKLSDFGMPPIGSGIVVQKALVQNHPDVVKAIVNATLNGYYLCIKNPQRCAQDFVNINASFDYNGTFSDWQSSLIFEVGYNATTIGNLTPLKFGWMNATTVQGIVKASTQIFNLTRSVDPTTLYTNQFVQQP